MAFTNRAGPKVIKLFSCSTQLSMKFFMQINLKLLTIPNSFMLNIAEHEKSFIISGPDPDQTASDGAYFS